MSLSRLWNTESQERARIRESRGVYNIGVRPWPTVSAGRLAGRAMCGESDKTDERRDMGCLYERPGEDDRPNHGDEGVEQAVTHWPYSSRCPCCVRARGRHSLRRAMGSGERPGPGPEVMKTILKDPEVHCHRDIVCKGDQEPQTRPYIVRSQRAVLVLTCQEEPHSLILGQRNAIKRVIGLTRAVKEPQAQGPMQYRSGVGGAAVGDRAHGVHHESVRCRC